MDTIYKITLEIEYCRIVMPERRKTKQVFLIIFLNVKKANDIKCTYKSTFKDLKYGKIKF